MPGKSNSQAKKGKGLNRKDSRGLAANSKIMDQAAAEGIDQDSMRTGKVTKNVGNSRFLVDLSDGRAGVNVLCRDILRAKGTCGLAIGTIVLVSLPNWQKEEQIFKATGISVKDPEAYIEGVVNTKKWLDALKESGDIPERFTAEMAADGEGEAGFFFEAESEDESEDEEDEEGNVIVSNSASAAKPKKAAPEKGAKDKRTKAQEGRVKKDSETLNIDDI
jgi:hypothetical protein